MCEAGELAKWIKKQGPIPENESKIIMRQIVDAISYLHKNGIWIKKNFTRLKIFKRIFV